MARMNLTNDPFQRRFFFGAAFTLAALAGCSADHGSTSSEGSESSETGTASSSITRADGRRAGGSHGGDDWSHGGRDHGHKKPADCDYLPLHGIDLVSQEENQFDSSDTGPVIRTPSSLANITATPELFDRLRLLFDGAVGVGVHPIDPDPNHAVPNFITAYVPTCKACAVYQEDLDPATNQYKKLFAAKAGELEITHLVTPHQTAGAARHVELREIAADPSTGVYDWVPGGKCYWIEEAHYDVRRPNGCKPFVAGSCPHGRYCMPTNAIGSDGECVTGGSKGLGEACTTVDDTHWDSDCRLGLRCIDAQCYEVCDVLSTAPGCPAGTHCGGGYNLCLDEATVLADSGVDGAAVGQPCTSNPWALYCGGDGKPGTCYDDDGDGPRPSMCRSWSSAPSQCVAPQTAGYVAYKEGIDKSTLWCLTPP